MVIGRGLLEQLGLLGRIGEVAGEIPGGGGEFHLIALIVPAAIEGFFAHCGISPHFIREI